jgi:hypothetical protein
MPVDQNLSPKEVVSQWHSNSKQQVVAVVVHNAAI